MYPFFIALSQSGAFEHQQFKSKCIWKGLFLHKFYQKRINKSIKFTHVEWKFSDKKFSIFFLVCFRPDPLIMHRWVNTVGIGYHVHRFPNKISMNRIFWLIKISRKTKRKMENRLKNWKWELSYYSCEGLSTNYVSKFLFLFIFLSYELTIHLYLLEKLMEPQS